MAISNLKISLGLLPYILVRWWHVSQYYFLFRSFLFLSCHELQPYNIAALYSFTYCRINNNVCLVDIPEKTPKVDSVENNFFVRCSIHFRIIPNSYAVLALGSNHWMGFIYRCFGFMVQILEKWRVRFQSKNGLTKRAPDAGDSAHIPNSFTRLSLFLAGRLRRPRPSAGNANR